MNSRKFLVVSAAVLLALLLVPHPYLADSRDNAQTKISVALAEELAAAQADEPVTAIVKMRGQIFCLEFGVIQTIQ